MILADTDIATDWLDLFSKIGFVLLGAAIGWVAEWIRNRSKLIHDVAESYIADRRSANDDDSPCRRLGAMQRAGLGLLKNNRQIMEFSRVVVGRGCTHPFLDSDVEQFLKKDRFIQFLNAASHRGVSLNTDMALYEVLVQGFIEAEEQERKSQ